jgi:hypothetical protein
MPALHSYTEGCGMENVLIRECSRADIDAILRLERQWEQEDIAYGDFNPISREDWIDNLERFQAYFLVAEYAEHIIGYINATVQRGQMVEVITEQQTYVAIENIYIYLNSLNGFSSDTSACDCQSAFLPRRTLARC